MRRQVRMSDDEGCRCFRRAPELYTMRPPDRTIDPALPLPGIRGHQCERERGLSSDL